MAVNPAPEAPPTIVIDATRLTPEARQTLALLTDTQRRLFADIMLAAAAGALSQVRQTPAANG